MTTRSGLAHRKKVQAKIQDANRTFKIADKKGPEPGQGSLRLRV